MVKISDNVGSMVLAGFLSLEGLTNKVTVSRRSDKQSNCLQKARQTK